VHPGDDLTVITYGAVVPRALQAINKLERENGVHAELLDLRTLSPYDWTASRLRSVKTNRVLVAYEDCLSWGYAPRSPPASPMNSSKASTPHSARSRTEHIRGLTNRSSKTKSSLNRMTSTKRC